MIPRIPNEIERLTFIRERVPDGIKPDFRILACQYQLAHPNRKSSVGIFELALTLTWHRWKKRLRIARYDRMFAVRAITALALALASLCVRAASADTNLWYDTNVHYKPFVLAGGGDMRVDGTTNKIEFLYSTTNETHSLAPFVLLENGETVLGVDRLWTNRSPHIIAIVSTGPVPGNCPECSDPHPNHHDQQVLLMADQPQLLARLVAHGTTSQVVLHTWPLGTNYFRTNIIPRVSGRGVQPGWPPVPISPHAPLVATNKDLMPVYRDNGGAR
jgi:hypothetical protein